MGIWVISTWLMLLFFSDRPLYNDFVASGAQSQNCIAWDANGHAMQGECSTPPPSLAGPKVRR